MLVPPQLPPFKKWNRLIILGEAPGAEEEKSGKPFQGTAGKMLNEVLSKAGIERKNCIVMNVFQTRPPNNKIKHMFQDGKLFERVKDEYTRETSHAALLMWDLRPNIVIALGKTALWLSAGYKGNVLDRYGKFSNAGAGSLLLAMTHPSYWQYSGDWNNKKSEIIKHFKRAKMLSDNFYVNPGLFQNYPQTKEERIRRANLPIIKFRKKRQLKQASK